MKTTLNIKKSIVSGLCLLGLITASYTHASDGVDLKKSPEMTSPTQQYAYPKEQDQIPLQYVGQPPLIPHSIETYQINRNVNACMNCHDIRTYKVARSRRISASHFQNNTLAATHYFCLACHVEQTDAPPIVENNFQPAP